MERLNYGKIPPQHIKSEVALLGSVLLDPSILDTVMGTMKQKYLYSTKLIKLLYIIDEKSVLSTGTPISWLTYYVYKMGPEKIGL